MTRDERVCDCTWTDLPKCQVPLLPPPAQNQQQRKSCEGALSEREVLSVLKQMKTRSAPGSDGITVKFLKVFWSHLGKFITASFSSASENGKMLSLQCKAVNTLVHKGKELP